MWKKVAPIRARQPGRAKLPKGVSYHQQGPAWNVVNSEINVVGRHAEEALEEVDKFLDQAALAQVERVRIVHGFGMGVLRKAISGLLEKNPHVEKILSGDSDGRRRRGDDC